MTYFLCVCLCPGASDGGVQYRYSGVETKFLWHVRAGKKQRPHEWVFTQGKLDPLILWIKSGGTLTSHFMWHSIFSVMSLRLISSKLTLCWKHVQKVSVRYCVSFCVYELPTHVVSPPSRPKAIGWAPVILRRVPWATTSAAPTSLISAWHTAARPSLKSFNSSLKLCALKSWTRLMRRTLWPWPLSREDAEMTKHPRVSFITIVYTQNGAWKMHRPLCTQSIKTKCAHLLKKQTLTHVNKTFWRQENKWHRWWGGELKPDCYWAWWVLFQLGLNER